MINLDEYLLKNQNMSISDKIAYLKNQHYLAEDTKDFNDNIGLLKYPLWKHILFPDKNTKNNCYILIHNVGITIKEKNPYLSDVVLHDSKGKINLYWMDIDGFYDDVLKKKQEEMERKRLEKRDTPTHAENFNFFGIGYDEFKEKICNAFENFVLYKMHEETFGNIPFPLSKPNHTLNEVREKQGLKDEDYISQAIITYSLKNKIGYISWIQKNNFSRKIKSANYIKDFRETLMPQIA